MKKEEGDDIAAPSLMDEDVQEPLLKAMLKRTWKEINGDVE